MSSILRWSKYTLPCGRRVYLTNRPDNADDDKVEEFIRVMNPGVRFQFTDDNLQRPENDPPYHWFAWFAGSKGPATETVFSAVSTISRYVGSLPTCNSIWMHCDSSSMRAPTFFGLYLYAHYTDERVKEICDEMISNVNKEYFSRPDEYAQTSFKLEPFTKTLVDAWRAGGEALAWATVDTELDSMKRKLNEDSTTNQK